MNILLVSLVLCIVIISSVNAQWGYPMPAPYPITHRMGGPLFPPVYPPPSPISRMDPWSSVGSMGGFPSSFPAVPVGAPFSFPPRPMMGPNPFMNAGFGPYPSASRRRYMIVPVPPHHPGFGGPRKFKEFRETKESDSHEADQIIAESRRIARGGKTGPRIGKIGKFSLGNPLSILS